MNATLYLGTDRPGWLAEHHDLFVSRRTLAGRKTFPRAVGRWVLDSGGFTEIGDRGSWDAVPEQVYVNDVRRFADEIGHMAWAAPQDWMCEPSMLAKTGLSVDAHQTFTVHNLLYLRHLAPDLPIIPVLQGWTLDDYLRCVDLYDRVGVDLTREPLVGVGSVCRRNSVTDISTILRRLGDLGISLHAFGVKGSAFARLAHTVTSADSFAWSYTARHAGAALPGCKHRRCNHCSRYALAWRDRITNRVHPELAFR